MTDPHLWSLTETKHALENKKVSACELLEFFLRRIHRFNSELHAFITVNEDATRTAREIDDKRSKGQSVGPLGGVPIAMKDLMDTANLRTTYGGLHYRENIPKTSATVVRKLEDAGAIIVGKTNLHEYAYSTTNENPHYGTAKNPWAPTRIAGGSSGGSSVAVTAGLTPAAVGTDTGGSIRIPAALTGHVGLKPTFGLVSKAGVFPLAPSLDHVGPMTKTVGDAAVLLDVMAGYDPLDEDSIQVNVAPHSTDTTDKPIRLGVPKQFFFELCDSEIKTIVQQALQTLEHNGFKIIEVDVPYVDQVPDMQRIVISSEAFYVHRNLLKEAPDLYGEDVRSRLELSSQTLGYEYVLAKSFHRQWIRALDRLFEEVDALVTPTTPIPATPIGDWTTTVDNAEVPIRGTLTRFTNPWNFSGLPAISIPCGTTPLGLPVGLQLVAAAFSERNLLSIAQRAETCFHWTAVAPRYRNS